MKFFKYALLALALPVSAFAATEGSGESRWNVSTNPLGLIVGPNARLEYKLNEHLSIGPTLSAIYINAGGLKATGFGGGIDVKYYFKEAFAEHTWWTSAGLRYGSVKFKYTDSSNKESNADVRQASLPIMGGYQWFWGNFNLALGAGPSINYTSSREIIDENGNKKKDIPYVPVGLAADASLGWTF